MAPKKSKLKAKQENKGRKAFELRNNKYANEEGEEWANQLPASQLDLMISIKRLAVERMSSLGDHSVAGFFTWKSLRCLEIILEEFMKEQITTSCPSVMSRLEDSK